MRKVSYLLFALVLFILPIFMNTVHADETKSKINVYLFRGEGCPHCAEAEEWFEEQAQDEEFSSYYELIDFEVWDNKDNSKLMNKVASELKTQVDGVPFIVVGDKYFGGFSSKIGEEIKEAIISEYNNEEYTDVVAKVQEKLSEKNNQKVYMPIIIVSVVAVISVVILVFFTKEKEE